MPNDMIPPKDDTRLNDSIALDRLRSYIEEQALKPGEKLPPERLLSEALGLRRSDLRKALETLERENRLWRHVGKGTFLSSAPAVVSTSGLERLAQDVSPADVMRARSALEPAIAREACLHATAAAISKLNLNMERARQAPTWREYEALDHEFHRQIAEASGSITLLALFEQLNALRRMVSTARITRATPRPPEDHGSFADHARIAAALSSRNPEAAEAAMRAHLRAVDLRLFR